ncbi:MAG TPA: recombinase family protein [Stellaceae bacterium]|jgi:DNA invertase Pin-like site-specific DNA recombinase|nr:recombinase family protein [Stellaceae bacterium]
MNLGYARVSTEEQNLDMQRRSLRAAGCERVFEDCGVSGAARSRPQLDKAFASLRQGDILVVWKLDRLGRSLSHLIEVMQTLGEQGVGFQSMSEAIDTTTAGGRLVFHMMGALAEFERSLIAERTRAGMAAAKARGEAVGRPPKLTRTQVEHARRLIKTKSESVTSVARSLRVSRATLYRALLTREASAPGTVASHCHSGTANTE